jgi:hypothetical protein
MRRSALALAILMVATAPALAAEKKKKRVAAKPAAETVQQIDSNEASWRLVKGSLPLILPSWSMPLYMQAHGNEAYKQLDEEGKAKLKAGQAGKRKKPGS